MISTILSMFGGQVIEKIWDGLLGVLNQYMQKQISEVQAKQAIMSLLLGAFRDIEVAQSEALAKTYESFQVTMRGSPLLQAAWVALFLSQMLVLVWLEIGVPALCYTVGNANCYPSPGATVNWSYLLLAFMLGAGPIVFRNGPGEGSLLDRLKKVIS